MADALSQLQTSLAEAKQEIATSAAMQIDASKAMAEQLITAVADYVAAEVRAAALEVHREIETVGAGNQSSTSSAHTACWVAAALATLNFAGTVLVAYTFL